MRVIVAKEGVSQKGSDGKLHPCPVGSEIDVSAAAFEMLKARGLIEERKAAEAKPDKKPGVFANIKRAVKEDSDGS